MHILIDLLVRNRRLVGRMYGYGCALICLLETSTDPEEIRQAVEKDRLFPSQLAGILAPRGADHR